MTQPSEKAFRKACEEAGIVPTWADLSQQLPDAVIPRLLTALARRIEAEAVPVAWMIDNGPKLGRAFFDLPTSGTDGEAVALYAHPPKDPTT